MKDVSVKQILESKELQEAVDKFVYLNEIDTSSEETNDLVDAFILGFIAAKQID